jgi:hypothetical protein
MLLIRIIILIMEATVTNRIINTTGRSTTPFIANSSMTIFTKPTKTFAPSTTTSIPNSPAATATANAAIQIDSVTVAGSPDVTNPARELDVATEIEVSVYLARRLLSLRLDTCYMLKNHATSITSAGFPTPSEAVLLSKALNSVCPAIALLLSKVEPREGHYECKYLEVLQVSICH